MAKVMFSKKDVTLKVLLYGDIDHHGAKSVRELIDNEILKTSPKVVILDFSNVEFMDSSGIGLVLARYRFCNNLSISLYVGAVSGQISKILSLAGIKTINNQSYV